MDFVHSLSSLDILGKPPIFWGGLFVFIAFSLTGLLSTLTLKGVVKQSVRTHQLFALASIIFALFHATLGILTSGKIISILGGIFTFILFAITGLLAFSTVRKGRFKVSVKTHQIMVYVSLVFALMHAIYGIFLS
jgi:hypothetical protein